jgi:hypothetical protein
MKEQSSGNGLIFTMAVLGIAANFTSLLPEVLKPTALMRYTVAGLCLAGFAAGFYQRLERQFYLKLQGIFMPRGIKGIYTEDIKTAIQEHMGHIRTIRIMAVSANRLLIYIQDELIDVLAKNHRARVMVLVAAPGSDFVNELEEIEAPREIISDEINTSIKKTEAIVDAAQAKAEKKGKKAGTLEIRSTKTLIRSAITIINEEWGCLSLYLPPRHTENSTSLELVNSRKQSLLNDCINHFDAVWEKCAVKKSG